MKHVLQVPKHIRCHRCDDRRFYQPDGRRRDDVDAGYPPFMLARVSATLDPSPAAVSA